MPTFRCCTLEDLPVELLSEICWQSSNHSNILLVSRRLRDVIYSTAIFWQTINIGEAKITNSDTTLYLKKRLERSGECLLNVSIELPESESALEFDLWDVLQAHTHRFRLFILRAGSADAATVILLKLFNLEGSPVFMALQELSVHLFVKGLDVKYYPLSLSSSLALQRRMRLIPSIFPRLTGLTLSYADVLIPYLDEPLLTLTTLILFEDCRPNSRPSHYQVMHILKHTPNLETLWCKDRTMGSLNFPRDSILTPNVQVARYLPPDALPSISLPVYLPRLVRMALTVPGISTRLLHDIHAPSLHDLHLDGTRGGIDPRGYHPWLSSYPEEIYTFVRAAAPNYPSLRRLALIRVYLTRGAWGELLGCISENPPFPMLESVALRGCPEVHWEVYNEVNDGLVEWYAREGRISLRRFAYTDSEPQLSGRALHQLVHSVRARSEQSGEDVRFELELDGEYGVDTTERLRSLVEAGIRVTLHEEPYLVQEKRASGLLVDIDSTEADSY